MLQFLLAAFFGVAAANLYYAVAAHRVWCKLMDMERNGILNIYNDKEDE